MNRNVTKCIHKNVKICTLWFDKKHFFTLAVYLTVNTMYKHNVYKTTTICEI